MRLVSEFLWGDWAIFREKKEVLALGQRIMETDRL